MRDGNIILTGGSGFGKTTFLLKILSPFRNDCGGYVTQRLIKSGRTQGFCIKPFAEALTSEIEYAPGIASIFLKKSDDGWERNDDVFLTMSLSSLSNIEDKKLIVMDEIGGFELIYPEFRRRIREITEGDIPWVAVLKGRENLEAMCRELALPPEYKSIREEFEKWLTESFGSSLVCL